MNILTVLNKNKALELADFLDDLSVNGGNRDYGICPSVKIFVSPKIYFAGAREWLCESFKLWSKYSGNYRYPVDHAKGVEDAYHTLRKWSKRTQYGKDRRELCTFLANLIRSQCDE